MAKRRVFSVFSLSFLDIMSCGFGAVILIYLVINHSSATNSQEANRHLQSEVNLVEELVENEQERLVRLRNTRTERVESQRSREGVTQSLTDTIEALEAELAMLTRKGERRDKNIEDLKSELRALEKEATTLEQASSAAADSTAAQTFAGEGDRLYLTGMKVGGQHVLILLDASASMLDRTLVNVLRRRNMSDEQKLQSAKWQRAVKTVRWITANLPRDASFQLFTFAETPSPAIADSAAKWLSVASEDDLEAAMQGLEKVIPEGGTSLANAFTVIKGLSPQPDNIFLIVDGLPTQGETRGSNNLIGGRQREELFRQSLNLLPDGIPVNTILMPMEGDPVASASYWWLAISTAGSFLSPPDDWP